MRLLLQLALLCAALITLSCDGTTTRLEPCARIKFYGPDSTLDTPAQPIGGIETIERELRYPEIALRATIEGTAQLVLTVDGDGRVSHAQVQVGIGAGLDEEALRLVTLARFVATGSSIRYGATVRFNLECQV